MKRVKRRRTSAMIAVAIIVGSVGMGEASEAFATGSIGAGKQGTLTAADVNLAADNSPLRFSEFGALGKVFNETIENKNGFGIDGSPETIPGLLTLLLLAAGLLGIALMPRPYRWKRENMWKIKAETLKNLRISRRPHVVCTRRRTMVSDNPLSVSPLTTR